MGSNDMLGRSTSIENVSSSEVEAETSNINSLEAVSSGSDTIHEIESAEENLTRLELDLACSSEKLVNLDILCMHVAARENDFEAFAFEGNKKAEGQAEKAFEFDILYGVLNSEVREMERFLSLLQTEIISSLDNISSFKQLGVSIKQMEDRLNDCEDSLKGCFEKVSDIKVQSANFLRILQASSGDELCEDDKKIVGLENGDLPVNSKIKMQTAEQKRIILRMLEKSLAREIDLENKLNELRRNEGSLKHQMQREVFCMEVEAEDMWQRLFEAENSAEILLVISIELSMQTRMTQESLNKSTKRVEELQSKILQLEKRNESRQTEESSKLQLQREVFCTDIEAENMWQRLFEAENCVEVLLPISKELFKQMRMVSGSTQSDKELQSKIQLLTEQLKENDHALKGYETARTELSEKVNILELKLRESESQLQVTLEQNKEFEEKATGAEKRAEMAETEIQLLRESITERNKDVNLLKSGITDASDRLQRMERLLIDSETRRLHAEASAEASQEKQSMLECTIKDMDNLIKDLKSKVVKAERLAESAEDKCIILSESNAELSEELNFLRHRIQNLDKSLRQADESKKGTAKDITVRTKLIADLVVQLALERERLHNQISSLAKENKVAVMYLQQMKEPSVTMTSDQGADVKESVITGSDSRHESLRGKSNEKLGSSATSCETGSTNRDLATAEIKMGGSNSLSELDTVRNIDPRQLNFKYIFMFVVLVIPLLAAFLYQQLGVV